MENAARAAQLDEGEFPDGYDTIVGEHGACISGGQGQRIIIARAIIKNAKIVLMDEATSKLDYTTEHRVQLALKELLTNRTTIVVAHRLNTIKTADRIIYLDHGAIKEEGTPAELEKMEGAYYEMLKNGESNLNKTGGSVRW